MQEIEKRNKELLEEVEKLKRQVKILKARKKYGLVWEEEKEPEQIVLDCQYKIPVLKEIKNKDINTDKEKPVNVLIEGDNYHSLSVLNYTHKGKIDVIYIDPPYNTGKTHEWKYNDKWVDEEDTYRHSKWLAFMNRRLKLAKNCLKESGVIFISIDDNEMAQLRILCDEIFGENNRLDRGMIIWNNAGSTKGFRNIVKNHEYILAYAKNFDKVKNYFGENFKDKLGTVEDRLQIKRTSRNPVCRLTFFKGTLIEEVTEAKFEKSVGGTTNKIDIINGPMEFKNGKLNKDVILEASFPYRFQVEEYYKNIKKGEKTYDSKGQEIISIFFKPNGVPYYRKNRNIQVLDSVQKDLPNSGLKDLQNILSEITFNNPKPVSLISRLLSYFSAKNSLILDFMAGSGTTGQAVLELNQKDDGKRKFILCTNNEDNNGDGIKIATDICHPRIKTLILERGSEGNLKYFKTELLDIEHISHVSDEQKIKLTYKAGEMIALREGAFIEVEKDEWWQIFRDGTKYTAIYFKEDKRKLNELVKKLSKLKEKVVLYIFSWGKNEYKNEFTEYKNIKVEDIPEPIIDVYKEINRLS